MSTSVICAVSRIHRNIHTRPLSNFQSSVISLCTIAPGYNDHNSMLINPWWIVNEVTGMKDFRSLEKFLKEFEPRSMARYLQVSEDEYCTFETLTDK